MTNSRNEETMRSRATRRALLACGITAGLLGAIGCEQMEPGWDAPPALSLQGGMGLNEAAGALGSEGQEEASGMRTMPVSGNDDWNVEWRMGRVYEVDETRVVAVYAAWSSSNTNEKPPSSAYRLVDWARRSRPTEAPITLWTSMH